MACKVTLGELVFSGEKKHEIPEGMNLIGETLTVSGCGTFDVVAVQLLTPDNKITRIGGVQYTVKDGIVYDAKKLLRDVKIMVDVEKKKTNWQLKQPGVE